MNVMITEDLRVRGEERQWVIDSRTLTTKGDWTRWRTQSYHPSLAAAVRHAKDQVLRVYDATIQIGDLVAVLERVSVEIEAMMASPHRLDFRESEVYLEPLEPVDKAVDNL